jgi:hypothetical protein
MYVLFHGLQSSILKMLCDTQNVPPNGLLKIQIQCKKLFKRDMRLFDIFLKTRLLSQMNCLINSLWTKVLFAKYPEVTGLLKKKKKRSYNHFSGDEGPLWPMSHRTVGLTFLEPNRHWFRPSVNI